jgi:NADH-quinone oxidoreductase subunit L
MGYSTVSQLGFMFAGLGVLTSNGAAYHVFTHAFFKATLFLSCGAVMHGFAGQLDLRKLSGVWKMPGWKIVGFAMLIGCINLAGVPFTAGFFSKDMILAEALVTPHMAPIGWILLFTAGLTAYYTFRVFFRVFMGPQMYEPGDELHAHDDDHAHDHDHGHAPDAAHAEHAHEPAGHAHDDHGHGEFHPHAPGWAINLVLTLVAIGSLVAAVPYFLNTDHHGWVGSLLHVSTAAAPHAAEGHAHGDFLGQDPHKIMYYVSAGVGAVGILIAFLLHLVGRKEAAHANADKLIPVLGPVEKWARGKWYVDELYDFLIVKPLWVISNIFHVLDKLLVDGLVNGFGALPRMVAKQLRPGHNGILQGYAVGMAGGLGVLLLIVWVLSTK